jgi:hypothetical protein
VDIRKPECVQGWWGRTKHNIADPAEITLNELRMDDNANHANQQEGVQGLGYVAGLSLEVRCCTRSPDEVMWTESTKYGAPSRIFFMSIEPIIYSPKKQ